MNIKGILTDLKAGPALVAFASLVVFSRPTLAEEGLREVSASDRAAVVLALDYLRLGPESWIDDLAASSALKRSSSAAREIELRAGPAEGARWRLATSARPESARFHIEYPSGLEEVLAIDFVQEGGELKIAALRAGWNEAPRTPHQGNTSRVPAAAENSAQTQKEQVEEAAAVGWPWRGILAGVLVLVGGVAFFLPGNGRIFTLAGVGVGLVVTAVWPWIVGGMATPEAPAESTVADSSRRQSGAAGPRKPAEDLLDWRRRFALGQELPGADLPTLPIARLWAAQEAIASDRIDVAERAMAAESLAGAADTTTAAWNRSRLASRRGDDADVLIAYEELLEKWTGDEIFLAEGIGEIVGSGLFDKATPHFDRLLELQPRWPEAQILLALQAAMEEHPLVASMALDRSIRLGPVRRSQILGNPLAVHLIGLSSALRANLALAEPKVAEVRCELGRTPALADQPEVEATRVGASLFLSVRSGELLVPGGCSLAPPGAQIVDAEDWLDRQQEELLSEVNRLQADLTQLQGRITPALRRNLTETLAALMEAERYSEILRVTAGLGPEALDSLPGEARRARVEALRATGRRKDAFELLVKLIGSDFDAKRNDPALLFHLAELMAEEKRYDLAHRLYLAGDRRNPFQVSEQRRLQLMLEKKLLERSVVLERPPFKIYYSPSRGPKFVAEIADYLERERKRLSAWIPLRSSPKKIEVLLLDPEDFTKSYGFFVLGLYDGRVRVPLGQMRSLNAFAAALLTHELSHALITEASDDRAPHWFQEGLAQLVEPGQYAANPISSLKGSGKWVHLSLVEPVLSGMVSPELAQLGYEEALWTSVYLQETKGKKVFGELMAAWRQGAGEQEALRKVTGLSLEQLDENLVIWGMAERLRLWETAKPNLP